jgi:ATP-dependent protease ClpP protease subunit
MKWYTITAKSDVSEIWLYDEIGKDFFGDGVTAKEFLAELNAIKSPKIDMHINSPGGAVFDGAAIYNAVKRHPAAVTTYIDGIAASIASVIALAGEKVIMAANALYMMHNPSGLTYGTSEDMRKTADILDKVRDTMVGAYTGKSGKTEGEIVALLDAESWLDAEEAMAAGFVDVIGDEMDMAACAKFVPVMSKLGYQHIPQSINGKKEIPSRKEIERILRDAGCSRKAAKSILAKGYSDGLRDAGADDGAPPVVDPPRDVEKPKPAGKVTSLRIADRHERLKYSTN